MMKLVAGGAAAGAVGAALAKKKSPARVPAVFISHGSPMVAVERDDYTTALLRLGAELHGVEAIVVVSAHWQASAPIRVTAASRPPLIYDFYGFPDELYRLTYPSPGAPELAGQIVGLLGAAGLPSVADAERGLDHGVWVPLRLAFPKADVPVIEVSLLGRTPPADLLRVGRALAPLRERRVLLIGSGGVTHNLRRARLHEVTETVDTWAREFDAWVRDRVAEHAIPALVDYRDKAPGAALSVPTTEHFDPLFVVLGACGEREPVRTVYEGIRYANLSMRSFTLG